MKVIPQHPFDLAVYGNYLYWTDWVLHAVLRVNKYTGEEVVWLRKDVAKPMGIVAIANDTADCTYCCIAFCIISHLYDVYFRFLEPLFGVERRL